MAAKLEKLLRIFAYLMGKDYFCIRFYTMGFRSSVGLEQQPSKLWVLHDVIICIESRANLNHFTLQFESFHHVT